MKKLGFVLAAVFCLFVAGPATRAQSEDDVVISEFSVNPSAGKEYVELLVTKPGGVNMQGWTLSDVGTRAGATASTEGDVTLPAASYLANVPQGTYVVIVFTTPAANGNTLTEDTSLADGNGKLVLIVGTTAGLVAGGTIDNATADNVQLYAGTRAAGTLIDQVLVGTNASFIAGATWGDNNGATTTDNVNAGAAMASGSIARFVPTANTLAGFQDNDTGARFVVDAATYGTPGTVNTGVSDSAVTNPTYTSGNVDAGSFNGITIGGDVGLAGNVTVYGTMTISTGVVTTGASTLTIDCGGAISGASSTTYVNGNLKKNYCAAGVKGFEVGTANAYSPVSVNVTAGTFPADFTVKAVQGPQPNVNPATSLQRYWTLTEGGDVTANLNFNYNDPLDIAGTESDYHVIRVSGGTPVAFPNNCPVPGANQGCVDFAGNQASVSGVTNFSDWTLGTVTAPTAAPASISGQVTTTNGAPLAGVTMYLSGARSARAITDSQGNYRFSNVDTDNFYSVTPSITNYHFSPSSRSFSLLANKTDAVFTGAHNEVSSGNVIDTPEYFVRQHYLDFLGREPDAAGLNFWSDQIAECGNDFNCIERRTINVSAAYFLSIEFQETGGLVDGLYRASYGRAPQYAEFIPDTAKVAHNVIVNQAGWEGVLATNKEEFVNAWVERPAFHAAYDNLTNDGYVNALIGHTGVTFTDAERAALVNGLNDDTLTRAGVLQRVAQNEGFVKAKFNESFVRMEYFGYLRRDPDDAGFHFWLDKLNQFDGNFEGADMVKAFIVSGEYRDRFAR